MSASRTALVAVGALVAASLACTGLEGPPVADVQADSADTVIFGLLHNVTTDGVLQARIKADTAYMYDASQTVELHQLTVTFFTSVGAESSTLTANEGTYWTRTGNMEARGDVVGLTPDGRRLETQQLSFERIANRLSSDQPFVFDSPDRHLEGSGFESDPDFTDVTATNVQGSQRGN